MTPGLLQDRIARAASQGERALSGLVRSWAGGVAQLAGAAPDPETVVRSAFDVAEQVLRTQREAALDLLRMVRGRDDG